MAELGFKELVGLKEPQDIKDLRQQDIQLEKMKEHDIKEPTIVKVSEVNTKAEEIKQKRALPPKPGDRVNFNQLREWLALLSPDAADRLTIWVYRREPIINRQLVDPQADNNIDII